MNAGSRAYPNWIDYEWFAADSVGYVAVFTTAGVGPIPKQIVTNKVAMDSLGLFVHNLPTHGIAEMLVSLPRPDVFQRFAAQGVFTYDWADVHRAAKDSSGVYELYSRPGQPITIFDLPTEFRTLLQGNAFTTIKFSDSHRIDVRTLLQCYEPAD